MCYDVLTKQRNSNSVANKQSKPQGGIHYENRKSKRVKGKYEVIWKGKISEGRTSWWDVYTSVGNCKPYI